MGETEDFDLMEMHEVNFIETLSMHYLNLMNSPLNPLLGKQLERNTAVNTTIIILNNLFLDANDVIGFRWYGVRNHMTQNRKWDGVGFSVKDKKLTPILIEFSGGTKFNNTDRKEENDVNKLASACIESIEYTTAATDLIVPVPEFIVRFHDVHVCFESIIKLGDDLHIRRTYAVVPIPTRAALLQTFSSKTAVMYQWREAKINLVN